MHFRGTRNALIVAALVAAAGAMSSTPAEAAPPAASPDKARAAELFKKGSEAYLKGDFAAAIAHLEEAYKLDPQPVLVYNQARAHEGLGHTDRAIELYERYLADEPSSPDRGAIEQRLGTLKRQRDERLAHEKEREAIEKERSERATHAPPPPPPRKPSVLPYVVGGVGVAGLATGVVFGVLAKSKEDAGNSAASQERAADARDSGSTFATVANVSLVAGGVLLAAGAVWWVLDRGRTGDGGHGRTGDGGHGRTGDGGHGRTGDGGHGRTGDGGHGGSARKGMAPSPAVRWALVAAGVGGTF